MHKKSIVGLGILALFALVGLANAIPVQAAIHGSITLDSYSPGWIMFSFTAAGINDEDDQNNDFVAVVVLDGNCDPLAFVPWNVPVAKPPILDPIGISQPIPLGVEPITVVLFDTRGLVGNFEDLSPSDRIMDAASSDPEFKGCVR
jgi:hypothetical protein